MAPDEGAADLRWLTATALEDHGSWEAAAVEYAKVADTATDASYYARAAQAQIRCLMRAG